VARPRSTLAVLGALAVCAAGCTSDNSSKATASSSTLQTISSTVAPSTTASAPGGGSTTAPVAPGQTSITAGATNSTTASAQTTVANRVVSKPSDNVHLGDSGPGVKQIQTALAAHGYKVTVDGQFGPQTAQAVKAFQKAAGVKQDGIVGPVTWTKLQAAPTTTTTRASTSTASTTSTSTTSTSTTSTTTA
jgi:peptidoglycan hydrolase-like protein with peptidoglycan-binding domain